MDADKFILKAKIWLQRDNPFFAYLVANMKFKEQEGLGTMGVDMKKNCYYDAKFVESLSLEELEGVLAHEVMHIVFEHLIRGKDLESAELMNVACDMVINALLVENSFTLPTSPLIPYNNSCRFMDIVVENLDKKTAIMVYHELLQKLKDEGKIKYEGFDKHIFSEKGKDINNEELAEQRDNIKQIVGGASAFAKQKGDMSDGIKRLIDGLLEEKVNWKALLYRYVSSILPFDYTYNRPSKRSVSCGVYMPSILRESVEIVVSVDTSGSISQKELTEFMTEITSISKSFNNVNMKLLICDSEIKETYDIGSGQKDDLSDIVFSGGGGTSHIPIYDYISENIPNAQLLINFTDGYTNFPTREETKTIWVLTKNSVDDSYLDWGEIVRLE